MFTQSGAFGYGAVYFSDKMRSDFLNYPRLVNHVTEDLRHFLAIESFESG